MLITSKTNEKVKKWFKYHQKKYRKQDQRFLVEGLHLLEEAHQAGILECIIVEQGYKVLISGYEVYEVTSEIMEKLSMHVSKEHYIGVCRIMQKELNENWKKIILLDDVQDPGNVGTMIRTAYSFGFDAIILSETSVDLYADKLIRSTQGALFHLPVLQLNLKDVIMSLKKQGIPIYGTSLQNGVELSNFMKTEQVALVFGNEGNGVSDEILSYCDKNIYVEMAAFESLNVAVAAGICMYYFQANK